MLCELAHSFPSRIAALLERDRGLTCNFREETVTDLLMASLVGLEPFGIRVDFPDEPTTGGDMDWIFAAPREINGGRYLRLLLQAKRAHFVKLKKGGYWLYQHLDHGSPAGTQARTLIKYATAPPDGMATLPLYIFYHPTSAVEPPDGKRPAIEGVNLVFANQVAAVVNGGCTREQKKLKFWRDQFLPLSDFLCWPAFVTRVVPPSANMMRFLIRPDFEFSLDLTVGFHPDLLAQRL